MIEREVLVVVVVCTQGNKEGSAVVLFPRGILDCECDGVDAQRSKVGCSRGRSGGSGLVCSGCCKGFAAVVGAAPGAAAAVAVAAVGASRHC